MRRLGEQARGEGNLLPAMVEAVAAYATVGEIADRLRAAWGVHRGGLAAVGEAEDGPQALDGEERISW